MTGIPYNYGKYIDDKVSMTNQGHVSASKQIQSPASAGSRGLAKTTQFTKDKTQMKMGNTPISESMVEIRNILNRIDGVNVPVQEAPKQKAMSVDKIYDMVQNLEHVIQQHPDFKDYDKSIIMASLGQLKDDIAAGDLKETSVKEDDRDDKPFASPLTPDERISPKIKSQGMRDFLDVIIDKYEPNVYDQEEDSAKILYKYNSMTGNKLSGEQIDMLTDLRQKDDVEFEKQLTKAGVDLEKLGQVAKQYKDDPYESADSGELGRLKELSGIREEAVTDGKILSMISDLRDAIMEHPDMENDQKTAVFTAIEEIEQAVQGIYDDYEPFPEEDEMTFEDDDAFYEAFGELGFPEDETELFDAEYRGRKVPLNKPMRGDVKKFKVYVKDPKSGNVKKVNFGHGGSSARKAGQKTMKIRKSNPKARKSFRARHNCANPGPKTKARYWSCRKW